MGWPKLLVLTRHAESFGNTLTVGQRAEQEVATHAYSLTERGREQASVTGEFIRQKFGEFDIRYVSYYQRSKETMNIMCPGAKVYEDPRLAEAQRGIYHFLTREDMAKIMPWEIERKKREGLYHYRPPGGENWPDIELRIHSFLGTLARDCDGARVLMVVHGHWLLLFQKLIHHFSTEEAVKRYKQGVTGGGIFKNASVTWYKAEDTNGQPRLVLREQNVVPWAGIVPENPDVT